MFKIHPHLLLIGLVLSFNNIESRNIWKKSKNVSEPNGPNVAKTGMSTNWLIQTANKFLRISSIMLLAKPQVQNVTEKQESKKPKSDNSVEPINIVPYPRIG